MLERSARFGSSDALCMGSLVIGERGGVLRAAQVVLHLELVDLTVCIRRIVCFK